MFKVGDLVKLKDNLNVGEDYNNITLFSFMKFNDTHKVQQVSDNTILLSNGYIYGVDMLELYKIENFGLPYKVGDYVKLVDKPTLSMHGLYDFLCKYGYVSDMLFKGSAKVCEIFKQDDGDQVYVRVKIKLGDFDTLKYAFMAEMLEKSSKYAEGQLVSLRDGLTLGERYDGIILSKYKVFDGTKEVVNYDGKYYILDNTYSYSEEMLEGLDDEV